MSLRIIVLGAAAGGGLPQWNCGCPNCAAARAGRLPSLTQSSVAVSADGAEWAILNASPDIRAQLQATPALHPTGPRLGRQQIEAIVDAGLEGEGLSLELHRLSFDLGKVEDVVNERQ